MASPATRMQRGRPAPHGLEVEQVLAALRRRFGTSDQLVQMGRYRVKGRLGSGGLGLVFRAHDPTLGRELAIKVLRPGPGTAEHDQRLLREAQVLAKIRHPNVVQVFDVGVFEDQGVSRVFVAMELVEGTDLRGWLARPHTLRATIEAFVAVARGVAAAHEVGLLHRDLKPSNVLMGRDGSVKVADFGLAAFTHEARSEGTTAAWSARDEVATPSWRPGGTPPYMAPEQHRGEPLTPACDQFALCVSLFEALFGRRPFVGDDAELRSAKERGVELPRPEGASRHEHTVLRRVLRRGLEPSPGVRYPDMDALGDDLRRALGSPGRRWVIAGGTVAVTAAVVGVLAGEDPAPAPPQACAPVPEAATVGAPPQRGALAERLEASPALAKAWPGLAEALDDYAADVRQRWDGSCALPPDEREQLQQCLARSAGALAELRELFVEAEPELLARGWSLVPELPDPQACRSPDSAKGAEALRRASTARATLLAKAGRTGAARAVLEELRKELDQGGATRALRLLAIDEAELTMIEGRYDEARAQLEAVHFEAAAQGDTYAAARAAVKLIAEAYRMGDMDAALHWARTARPLLERVQPRDADLESVLEHNVALAHFAAGDLEDALRAIEEAVRRASAPGVAPSLLRGSQQVNAELLLHAGRPAEALAIHDALGTAGASSDRDVLATVVDLQSLGNVLLTMHDEAGAHRAYRRSYDMAVSTLGLAHPDAAAACISLARVEGEMGEVARGRARLASCLPGLVERLGDDHPHVVVARAMGGRLAMLAGEHDEALRVLRDSVTSMEHTFGSSHYVVADLLFELGRAQAAAGDPVAARDALSRSLTIRREVLPVGHVALAESLAALAELDAEAGQLGRARERMTEAVRIAEQRTLDPDHIDAWRERLVRMEGAR